MLGPRDFTFVSGTLLILGLSPTCLHLTPTCPPVHSGCSECSGPHDFALVSHLFPLISPLSPNFLHDALNSLPAWFCTCLPVCLPLHSWFSAAWFHTCLQCTLDALHDFTLLLFPTSLNSLAGWFEICLPLVSTCLPLAVHWMLWVVWLQSIGGSAVALAAILTVWLSPPVAGSQFVCPWQCDLQTIGGSAVALAAITHTQYTQYQSHKHHSHSHRSLNSHSPQSTLYHSVQSPTHTLPSKLAYSFLDSFLPVLRLTLSGWHAMGGGASVKLFLDRCGFTRPRSTTNCFGSTLVYVGIIFIWQASVGDQARFQLEQTGLESQIASMAGSRWIWKLCTAFLRGPMWRMRNEHCIAHCKDMPGHFASPKPCAVLPSQLGVVEHEHVTNVTSINIILLLLKDCRLEADVSSQCSSTFPLPCYAKLVCRIL